MSSDTSAAKALASENSNFAGVNFGPIIYFFKSVSMQHKTRQLVCVSDGAKALSNLYGKYRYDLVIKYLNSDKLLDTLFQVIPHDPCP